VIYFLRTFTKKRIIEDFFYTIIFLLIISILRFNFSFQLLFLWLGGLLGTEFLTISEQIFQHDLKLTKPIFKTVVFQTVLICLTFYIITSSRSLFVSGLIMTMNLQLLKDQITEYTKTKTLSGSWFIYLRQDYFTSPILRGYLVVLFSLFLFFSLFLIQM
jgi:hypothetical protein